MSESAAIKLVRRVRETGSTAPTQIGGYRKPLLAEHEDQLRELTATKNNITLAEIQVALVARDRGRVPDRQKWGILLRRFWGEFRRR